jgi:NADH-quinone oxidoreductase subunit E
MLRRLHAKQPATFAFTPANEAWARLQIRKYPEGRQASAIIPLLWRAQEQEGWLSKPAIEHVADMLGMAYIRALEVATFYFMFQLQPVGDVAHVQVCGTTSCMIMGAEDLVAVCKKRIAAHAHERSPDGRFSWEEVECLGACANAPMAQIGKDYYEDLTPERLEGILDELAAGRVPVPGPQNGRYASEPLTGLTSLTEFESGRTQYNGSVQRAVDLKETIKRIDGTEEPLVAPWAGVMVPPPPKPAPKPARGTAREPKPAPGRPADKAGAAAQAAPAAAPAEAVRPKGLKAARKGKPDDLKLIVGVGPVLERLLHGLGYYHFDQIAAWTGAEIAWVDGNLQGFKGRVSRDDWVGQAKKLMGTAT